MKESLPPAVTLRLPTGIDLEFRLIPAGEFRMGAVTPIVFMDAAGDIHVRAGGAFPAEEPVHWVRLTQPFYLGQFPVTQEQYAAFRPDHWNWFRGYLHCPVESVTWDDAVAFCAWLNDRSQMAWPSELTGFTAQLPSEAQWEYACRAGTETEYFTGNREIALAAAGWYRGNSDYEIHPVGLKEPNAFGLYDMHGNVEEWCADAWLEDAYKLRVNGVCDPEVRAQDIEGEVRRVIRGGDWLDLARFCRSAYRNHSTAANKRWDLGFRVCLCPGPSRAQTTDVTEARRQVGPPVSA